MTNAWAPGVGLWLMASVGGCTGDDASPNVLPDGSSEEGSGSSDAEGDGGTTEAADTGPTGEPVGEAEILFEGPPGAFFESVVVDGDGTVYFSDVTGHRVLRRTTDDVVETLAEIDGSPVGLGLDEDGTLYATAIAEDLFALEEPFVATCSIWTIERDGTATHQTDVPEASFLNGMSLIDPGVFLIADSRGGTLWRYDVATQAATVWLESADLDAPGASIPAANGVIVRDDAVFVSNTAGLSLLRIEIDDAGNPGAMSVYAESTIVDGFAFAESGTIYAATHLAAVQRIDENGAREALAGLTSEVLGNTALAFGRTASDASSLYVVTDGGLFANGGVASKSGPARLVRIDVGEAGD